MAKKKVQPKKRGKPASASQKAAMGRLLKPTHILKASKPLRPMLQVNEPEAEQRPDPTVGIAPASKPWSGLQWDKLTGRPTAASENTGLKSDGMGPNSSTSGARTSSNEVTPSPSSNQPSTPLTELLMASIAQVQAEKGQPIELPDTVAGYTPTAEQREVLLAATQPGIRCLVLPAGAGAGKTSTLKMLEEVLPGQGQYTAFNRSLVNESKAKFKKARCSTTHGLAFGSIGKTFSHRLNSARMRSDQIASRLGISDMEITVDTGPDGKPTLRKLAAAFLAGQVLAAVRRFCQSADDRIDRKHFNLLAGIDPVGPDGSRPIKANSEVVRSYLLQFAEKAWADLSSMTGQLPFSHDVYVKLWQLGKGPNKPTIQADYILLDEAQDTAPVFLDVLKQQTHALLIFVGDSNQAIYEWRGAVDAMRAFPDAPRRMLSQSFRFGQRIADVANSILARLEEPTDLNLKGLESIPSVVIQREPLSNPNCVLTRTNAAAVTTIMEAQAAGKRTHLIASVDEVLAFVRAARDLQQGRTTSHPDLGCFSTWHEVVDYAKSDEGQELRLWVKLIEEFTVAWIISALENQVPEEQADLVVCTAHKSKGREWDSVKLASDFPPACRMSDADLRLLYVAATRAKRVLDISRCTPFLMHRDKVTGEESPGIKVTFTGPMPPMDEALYPERRVDTPTGSLLIAATTQERAEEIARKDGHAVLPTNGNGRAKTTEFSWANYSGKWCVAGPEGHVGEVVEVARKNGSKSKERLGSVIKQFPERCIYQTT